MSAGLTSDADSRNGPATSPSPRIGSQSSPLRKIWRARVWLVIGPVRFYQRFLGPMLPKSCRFTPGCSRYMIDAILCYGVIKGTLAGMWRICRCNPFGGQGFDPVDDFAFLWERNKRAELRAKGQADAQKFGDS